MVQHDVDVCVVGGGMAGLCAAIASARNGARTILVHDRPVLGGNASSEIRMWISGARGENVRETGILEEVQLDNAYLNPAGNYSIWDAVLWQKATYQPNLTLLLNTSCCDGSTERVPGDPSLRRISFIRCWQLTSQTWHTISAKIYIDCSGDSILAPISGAKTRWGRESRDEFEEDIAPESADLKTMGNSLLIQLRRVDEEVSFTPPPFAYQFNSPEDIPFRLDGVQGHNFWWIELGGLGNTIRDSESIRDDLTRTAWGIWDYIKNRCPAKADAKHWALEWLGSLPGKRESRRYVGGHVLTQNDVRAAADPMYFEDVVAYGGWPMDDHHPAGLLYPGQPTIFHPAPSPYGIPYRCLFSENVSNLMMAGRNISVTHAALSSTRVMGTCSLLGQAAGTAAALAVKLNLSPSQLFPSRIAQLQSILMDDDCWLPGRTRSISPLTLNGAHGAPSLLSGHDRDITGNQTSTKVTVGTPVELTWNQPQHLGSIRLVFDSNLNNDKRMPCRYPQSHSRKSVPQSLVKRFRIETRREDGTWEVVHRRPNFQRLVYVPVNRRTDAVRFVAEETWGSDTARLFGFEATDALTIKIPEAPQHTRWCDIVGKQDPRNLECPPSEAVSPSAKHSIRA
jgi:hypothetical protein